MSSILWRRGCVEPLRSRCDTGEVIFINVTYTPTVALQRVLAVYTRNERMCGLYSVYVSTDRCSFAVRTMSLEVCKAVSRNFFLHFDELIVMKWNCVFSPYPTCYDLVGTSDRLIEFHFTYALLPVRVRACVTTWGFAVIALGDVYLFKHITTGREHRL